MNFRDYFRQQALELLSHRQISKDAIAMAQVYALLALSADPEPAPEQRAEPFPGQALTDSEAGRLYRELQEWAAKTRTRWTSASALAPAAQPDLPPVLHEIHAAITDEQVERAREYYRRTTDLYLPDQRYFWLRQSAIALAYLTALTERLAAGSDD